MRTFGMFLLVIAAIALFYSLGMDVTVGTVSGDRVVNFNLLSERASAQNFALLFGIIGAIFVAVGRKRDKKQPTRMEVDSSGRVVEVPIDSPGTKKCPFCAESVLAEAIKCKHCGSDLPAH